MKRRDFMKYTSLIIPAISAPRLALADDAELIVGCNTSFLPFEFKQGDHYAGFDIDLWAEIAKGIDRKWRLQPMDFAGLIPALQTRNIDVALAGLFIKDSRKQVIDFSDPYYVSGLSAVVQKSNTNIRGVADLSGKTIGTETGNVAVDYMKRNIKDAQVQTYPDINSALLALEAARIDAVIFDTPSLLYYTHTAGSGKARMIEPPLNSGDYYGIGFQKGSSLVAPANAQLASMKADGRYKTLYRKWFGQDPV